MTIVFYDGSCLFCSKFINYINYLDKNNKLKFCALQSDKAKNILSKFNITINYNTLFFLNENKIYSKSNAVIELFSFLNIYFLFLKLMYLVPKFVRDFFYDVFSQKRFVFGKAASCYYNSSLVAKTLSMILFCCLPFLSYSQNQIQEQIKKTIKDSFENNLNVQITIKRNNEITNIVSGFKDSFNVIDNNTVFNIGSTTKLLTSYLVYKALESKKININTPVSKILKDIKINKYITIKHLLSHKSGVQEIGNMDNINNAFSNDTFFMYNLKLYKFIEMDSLSSMDSFNYCNSNYLILGNILEKVYKKKFSDLVDIYIIKEFNLKNTYSYYSKDIKNIAQPYYDGENLFETSTNNYYKLFCYSAGGVASNSEDIVKIMESFFNNKKVFKYFKSNIDTSTGYGFGVEMYGDNVFGHSGDNIGFTSRNLINTDKNIIISILSNTSETKKINKLSKLIVKSLK